ncbi:MAG: 5-oxoprolinase subunit PxpB [Anaerolineae bacterium]|nr:5-oxoprolinase subunit PxpB [Anaerolineae bacterium]
MNGARRSRGARRIHRYPRIAPVGEAAFTVEFGDRIDEDLVQRVLSLDAALADDPFPGFSETVPTYRSLLVLFEPERASPERVERHLMHLVRSLGARPLPEGRLHEIPVCYGDACGPDLESVARVHSLTVGELIQLHTAPTYRVAMLGFAPGFAYLLGLDERLATPRLATPRTRVPAGSVGIAGVQTGLYALNTPGGWQIIGQTTLTLFDPEREPPFTLQAGDRVRFVASH